MGEGILRAFATVAVPLIIPQRSVSAPQTAVGGRQSAFRSGKGSFSAMPSVHQRWKVVRQQIEAPIPDHNGVGTDA